MGSRTGPINWSQMKDLEVDGQEELGGGSRRRVIDRRGAKPKLTLVGDFWPLRKFHEAM